MPKTRGQKKVSQPTPRESASAYGSTPVSTDYMLELETCVRAGLEVTLRVGQLAVFGVERTQMQVQVRPLDWTDKAQKPYDWCAAGYAASLVDALRQALSKLPAEKPPLGEP